MFLLKMKPFRYGNGGILIIAALILTGFTGANLTAKKTRINAKNYDGFQPLDAALVPQGVYIKLSNIPSYHAASSSYAQPGGVGQSYTEADNENDSDLMNNLISNIVNAPASSRLAKGQRAANLVAAKRLWAGIVPLQANRMPMGIFIPEDTEKGFGGARARTVREKIATGVRKVFAKLRRLSLKRGASFDYVRTFNGLSPLEAVFIPSGYYVPLSSLAGYTAGPSGLVAKPYNSSVGEATTTESKPGRRKRFVAGIEPLDSVLLPGGVFIPTRMSGLPALPPQVLIPPGGSGGGSPPSEYKLPAIIVTDHHGCLSPGKKKTKNKTLTRLITTMLITLFLKINKI